VRIQEYGGSVLQGRLLKKPEVCERIGFSPRKVEHMIQAGEIPSVKIGRSVRVVESDLDEWISNLQRQQAESAEVVNAAG
jgi:excisionase family DNA binding protein